MAGRIESEVKKALFIEACENLDPLKVIPEKLLQAQKLIDSLKMDEIDTTMLYKCGCPCDWVESAEKQCQFKGTKKRNPRYSNKCTACWLHNLTEEIKTLPEKEEYNFTEVLTQYKEYQKIGMSPSELEEILSLLGWDEIDDYGLLLDTVRDMKLVYQKK